MEVKLKFNEINVKEEKEKTLVKVLMLKGEKGEKGDGDFNVIEDVKVNGTSLPVSNKAVNVEIPTNISSFNNDSGYLVENDMQMVETTDVENNTQITDATGYGRLNRIYGDILQNGTPTPNNPINIDVVTGDIDITISNSDSTSSQSFELSIGNTELCKIGNYKDYIYKENDKWYLHKEIDKYKFNSNTVLGVSDNNSSSTTQSKNGTFAITLNNMINNISNNKMYLSIGKYAYNSAITGNKAAQDNLNDNTFCMRQGTNDRIYFRFSAYTGLTGNEISAQINNKELYYVLTTPSDTEILDSNLINQLNQIYNFSLYQNQSNFVISSNNALPTLNIIYAITNRDIYSKEEINDLIGDIESEIKEKCEFIFPGKWGLNHSGNSNIIKVDGKVLLFDTNQQSVYSYLKQMLSDEGITHIDYMVISHFDIDHRANLRSLINEGYIDSNSIYIHPNVASEYYQASVITWYDEIEAICTELGITSIVPTENQVINVSDNFSMRFGNVDLTYCKANYTNPNQASMVVECKHNNFYALIMGDAVRQAQQYLYDTGFIKNEIQLYLIPHHAIEHECYLPFYELINPKYAVAQIQMADFNLGIISYNQDSAILYEKGCANYYSFNNDDNIKFIEQNNSISCVKGKTTPHSGYSSNVHYIYVDSVNFNENKQDGTQTYPYKDLVQALGMCADFDNKEILISLANGTYGTTYEGQADPPINNICKILNRKNYIHISGNSTDDVILNYGLSIINCFKVRCDNLTIKPSNANVCASIKNSNVMFRNCKFINEEKDPFEGTGIYAQNFSNISTINCIFQYLNNAYSIVSLSKVNTYNDTFINLNNCFSHENGITCNVGNINSNTDFSTIGTLDNYSSSKYIHAKPIKYSKSIITSMTGDIDFPFSLNNIYKYLVINYECRRDSTTTGRGKRIIPFENINSYLLSEFNARADDKVSFWTMVLTIATNKITILRNTFIEDNTDGTHTVHTPSSSSDDSYGIKITSIDFV